MWPDEPTQEISFKQISKVFILIIALLAFSRLVFAAPFLVSDVPNPNNVTHYELIFLGETPEEVSAQVDGSLKYNIAHRPAGENSVSVKAVNYSELWGRQESDSVPFSFTRPVKPNKPAGLVLKKE